MEFFQQYAKEVVALLVPLITWLLNSPQRGEVKLVRAVRHSHVFRLSQLQEQAPANASPNVPQVQQEQLRVHTASVVVHNLGRKQATNVEIVLNFSPRCINFWPLRNKTIKVQEDGRYAVMFDTLAANEFVGFELLSVNEELPALVHVRCDQGPASEVKLTQRVALPVWKINLFRFFMFAGLGASAYFVLLLLQFLVLQTPSRVIGG